jgi:F-type H+-transporting ATPase subunit b
MSTMNPMGRQQQGRMVWVAAALVGGMLALVPPSVRAQHAEPATTPKAEAPASGDHAPTPAAAHDAAPAGDHGAAASHGGGEAEHGESILVTLARLANFAILAGVIWWFARKPLADHLASRGAQIRKDLVDAAQMRTTATARLADIETKLAALPGELDLLRRRGAEELEAERARMRAAAEAERDRLVEQARREIASQTRTARGQLRAHAASLAIDVAESRLRATLTPAEQVALVDDYATQMRNVQ